MIRQEVTNSLSNNESDEHENRDTEHDTDNQVAYDTLLITVQSVQNEFNAALTEFSGTDPTKDVILNNTLAQNYGKFST